MRRLLLYVLLQIVHLLLIVGRFSKKNACYKEILFLRGCIFAFVCNGYLLASNKTVFQRPKINLARVTLDDLYFMPQLGLYVQVHYCWYFMVQHHFASTHQNFGEGYINSKSVWICYLKLPADISSTPRVDQFKKKFTLHLHLLD